MQEILSPIQIEQKITRISHEIMEFAFESPLIYLAGICGNGTNIAAKIGEQIKQQFKHSPIIFEIDIDKDQPLSKEIKLSIDGQSLKDQTVILIDDVINSGKTMQYALTKLLEYNPKAIKTVALVERSYRRFPIKCDFVGLSLSTTLKNHVEVNFTDHKLSAHLY